jgi:DNA-binding transcriptional regulator YiaG
MPAHHRPLKATDGPLARFALALRRLRDQAPEGRFTSVDQVVKQSGRRVGRATIFSALNGTTLPSRDTLAVIVVAWSPGGAQDLAEWNDRRSKCEEELASQHTSRTESAKALPTTGTHQPSNPSDLRDFGPILRQLRMEAGISLGETARRINYSKGQLSKVENGLKRPTLLMARLLDNVLDTGGTLARIVTSPAHE